MAPLKQARDRRVSGVRWAYPWLRGHGSIEALNTPAILIVKSWYPWLRGHGSIEAKTGADRTAHCRTGIHG